jgi:hypothetical protein
MDQFPIAVMKSKKFMFPSLQASILFTLVDASVEG